MTKRAKTVEFDSNNEQETEHETQREDPVIDPNQPRDYIVLTDGAVFPKDKFTMRKADVPEPKEPEGDTTVCHIGDIVTLTPAEAAVKRASGIALGDVPTDQKERAA